MLFVDESLRGATELYMPSDIEVQDPSGAQWILSYKAPRLVPPRIRTRRVVRLARGIALIETGG